MPRNKFQIIRCYFGQFSMCKSEETERKKKEEMRERKKHCMPKTGKKNAIDMDVIMICFHFQPANYLRQ